ncbi:MAG: sensor histidine kinase [Senegalia sp. (in: firmicutes)]|uniref:sensor histidine kinase n=1 Tax=Senegalia sp. (in: firmicutes) TaxID=1924098 RepID=UPI003F98DE9A
MDKYEKIILNLLSNATKFTPQGGEIFINIYEENNHVIISIKDTGVGINKSEFKNIFEKFNNLKNNLPTVESGTGLGLNLVKTLVEKMNGEIKVKSTLGKGTEFLLYLPSKQIEDRELSSIRRTKKELEHITNIEFSDI